MEASVKMPLMDPPIKNNPERKALMFRIIQKKTLERYLLSTSYEWLVVTGSDYARFKGAGTINNGLDPERNPFKFMLWAGDGTGPNGEDTFRIRIWWEEEDGTEHVIYDNGNDREIGGGSIVVHTSNK
jgi:hypothetical protein